MVASTICGVHTPYISQGISPSDETLGIVGRKTLQPRTPTAISAVSAGPKRPSVKVAPGGGTSTNAQAWWVPYICLFAPPYLCVGF
jgi:hypothetical protein